jgi:hypothetical protein
MNPTRRNDPPCFEDYPETDEPETFDVPGIDDCDFPYSLSSRSGDSSVYIRVQQFGPQDFRAAMSVETNHPEGDNFMDSLPADEGPHGTPELAFRANVEAARQWFRDNGLAFVYCSDSRRIVRARHSRPV